MCHLNSISTKPPKNHTSGPTKRQLETEAQQEAFCEVVVEQGSVKAACNKLKLHHSTVFWLARQDLAFGRRLNAAWAACLESDYADCKEIADTCDNQSWSVARLRIETRMRMIGKLLPAIYGERPSAEVNITNNVGITCDDATRKRLIALRETLLTNGHTLLLPPAQTTGLENTQEEKPHARTALIEITAPEA